jgi:hypothetical protein
VYASEGILTKILGRPVSLSDCDIDRTLPLSIDDDSRMGDNIQVAPSAGEEAYLPTNLSQFILLSQLHVIEARIQRTVYRVDRTFEALQPKMHRLMADLEA